MTIVNVTEEAAEKARKWNWSIPKLITRWLEGNEVRLSSSKGTCSLLEQVLASTLQLGTLYNCALHMRSSMQTADEDPVISHHPMDEALEVLMGFAGSNFRKQSEAWSAALPNKTP